MSELKTFVKDQIWTSTVPFRFYGIETGAKMTILKLNNGDLFVHSPVKLTEKLKSEIDKIGKVKYLVSPNHLHHLYLGDFSKSYPKARVYASPGLKKKVKGIKFDAELEEGMSEPWSDEVEMKFFVGSLIIDEALFFHKKSRTLITTDMIQCYSKDAPFFTRIAGWINGCYPEHGVPRDLCLSTIFKRKQCRKSVKNILRWDFEKVIFSHAEDIKSGGKEMFKKCFAWIL